MRRLPLLLVLASCGCAPVPVAPEPPRAASIAVPAVERPGGETPDWWFLSGAAAAADRGAPRGRARNVILFVGDGMSLTTVAAARVFAGQRAGRPGEETRLAFEDLPYTALSRTYNTDAQTPDSAGTMTAMITGVKTRMGRISVTPTAPRSGCTDEEHALPSLLEIAEAAGLSTGIVTTTRLTHATPAATYAHLPDRDWEHDRMVPPDAAAAGCRDIAHQFVEPRVGDGPEVALGGGRLRFLRDADVDPEYPPWTGLRQDGRDLVAAWRARHPDGSYVTDRAGFERARGASGPLLGLFQPDHLQFEHDRPGDTAGEPSLAEMTRAAIERLARDPDGYVLMVEAGRIDHAHHFGNAYRALSDTVALSDAVRVALEATDARDTLVVVTADHSHTLTFAGYPARGNPILGLVRGFAGEGGSGGALARDALGLPYTTLGYANGPGYGGASDRQPEGPKRYLHDFGAIARLRGGRPDPATVDTTAPDYLQDTAIPLVSETHGGDDVGVWAGGPGAEAFRGSIEQHAIFHLMLQSTPTLREFLCRKGRCNADGVPVRRPLLSDLQP